MNEEAERIISELGLERLPGEGGWFRQTWTGGKSESLDRPIGTAIYFLITPEEFSALHRLETDEVWHFYAGDPVDLVQIDVVNSEIRRTRMGANVLEGQVPQHVVPAGVWQGAQLAAIQKGWALVGCTMAPGWDERDFQLADREELMAIFPNLGPEIRALTR